MDQFDVLTVSVRVRVSPRPSSSSFFSSHPLKLHHLTDQLPLSRCSNPSVDLQACDRVRRLPTEYWRIDVACIDNGGTSRRRVVPCAKESEIRRMAIFDTCVIPLVLRLRDQTVT